VRASALKLQEKRSGSSQAKSRCGPRPDPAIRLTRPSRPHGPNELAERSTNIRLPEQAGEGILQFKTASNPIPIYPPQPNTSNSPSTPTQWWRDRGTERVDTRALAPKFGNGSPLLEGLTRATR
jgi:hypothetical protein